MKRLENLSGLVESSKILVDGLHLLAVEEDKELLKQLRKEAQYNCKVAQMLYDSVQHIKDGSVPEIAR